MRLNQYIWNNYKQTQEGRETIALFTECDLRVILSKFSEYLPYDVKDSLELIRSLNDFQTDSEIPKIASNSEAEEFISNIIQKGITLTYSSKERETLSFAEFDFLYHLPIFSIWLYLKYPDFFKPYFFINEFSLLNRIADTFGLSLPVVPLKKYKEQRFLYYQQLCETFSRFQKESNLNSAELCAFLHDFAPNYLAQTEQQASDLPQATQVWWIGGDKSGGDFEFLDAITSNSSSFWQGNEDTKRGDILVMYCLAPRSCIHSIWRATADGIADPFFHYYSSIYIGHGQKVEPITIHELKADPYFSKNPLVRRNLQGISGYPLSFNDYQRMQEMIIKKGGDTSKLPQLYSHLFDQNEELKNEREVEVNLIEPLLIKIGFKEDDWVR